MEADFIDIKRDRHGRRDRNITPRIGMNTSIHMDDKDLQAVILVSQKYLDTDIDLIALTNRLEVYAAIDENKGREMRRSLSHIATQSRVKGWTIFLKEIVLSVSFESYVNCLYKEGLKGYADELKTVRYGHIMEIAGRADMPHAEFIQKFYCNLKQTLDNGGFSDSRTFLNDKITGLKLAIEQSHDVDTRQFNAEKLVAYYVLILPQYSGYTNRKALLDDMRSFFIRLNVNRHVRNANPEELIINQEGVDIDQDGVNADIVLPTVDSTSADIVYASKMAVTTAIAGNFDEARRYASEAEFRGFRYRSSLARTLANHDHQYIFRREYLKSHKTEYLSQVLLIGDRALRMLMEEHDDVRHQWNRLHILYSVLTLLNIKADFEVLKEYSSPKNIEHAKERLNDVRRSFEGIELRREMIYSLCMARVYEHSDIEEAITYMKRTISLSTQCHAFLPKEQYNLNEYLHRLKGKHMQQWLLQWLSEHLVVLLVVITAVSVLGLAVLYTVKPI